MKTFAAACLIGLLLCGCASSSSTVSPAGRDPSDGWIRGTMTCLDDASVYSFRIQKKFAFGGSASGGVVALSEDGKTRLSGRYTGMLNTFGSGETWSNTQTQRTENGSETQRSQTQSWQLGTANAQASVAGGGLVIHMRLLIRAGFAPHGTGEGKDNHGKRYQILF